MSLGNFCDEFDEYLDPDPDPEARHDRYFCHKCDEFVTSKHEFSSHLKFHETVARGLTESMAAMVEKLDLGSEDYDGEGPSTDTQPGKENGAGEKASTEKPSVITNPCSRCHKTYLFKADVWEHMCRVHRECPACNETFKSADLMQDHVFASRECLKWPASTMDDEVLVLIDAYAGLLPGKSSGGKIAGKSVRFENVAELLTCSICDYVAPLHTELNLHLASSHNKCLRCKVMFQTPAELQDHFSKSKVHKFCQVCSLNFPCNELLEEHRNSGHPPEKADESSQKGRRSGFGHPSYICEFCTKFFKSFDTLDKLESHLQREHIRCFPCKRNFSNKSSLLKHLEMQSSHNYCQICDTDYISLDALKAHAVTCGSKCRHGEASNNEDSSECPKIEAVLNAIKKKDVTPEMPEDAPPELEADESDSDEESEWETNSGEDDDDEKTVLSSVSNDEVCVTASKDLTGSVSIVPTPVKDDRFTCPTCGEKSVSATTLKKHLAAAHLKCLHCKIKFESESSLHEHFSNSRVHALKFCGVCKTDFPSKECSVAHSNTVHSVGKDARIKGSASNSGFSCEFCPKSSASFDTEDKLEYHLQGDHIRCFPCKRNFTQEKSLREHLAASSQHNYCCHCDTDFLCVESFNGHVQGCSQAEKKVANGSQKSSSAYLSERAEEVMTKDRIQKAVDAYFRHYSTSFSNFDQDSDDDNEGDYDDDDYDGDFFNNDDDLDSEDDLDLRCSFCLEEFDSKEDLDYHEYDNHLSCLKCMRPCASRKAYIEHHLTSKGHHMCYQCDMNFLLKQTYEEHRKSFRHALQGNTPITMSDANVKKKRFVCDDCEGDQIFDTEEEFQKHLDTNHWNCFPCDKEFKSKKALLKHWKKSNDHNFCHECEMNLATKVQLEMHMESGRHCD